MGRSKSSEVGINYTDHLKPESVTCKVSHIFSLYLPDMGFSKSFSLSCIGFHGEDSRIKFVAELCRCSRKGECGW